MDYEGKYFPDEDEEDISPAKKRRKKIVKYIFYGIVAFVYIVAFWVILSNCESDIYEKYVFSPKARQLYNESPEDFVVYELFPTTFMNFDGSVQISGVAYASTANELEIGIKYNKKLLATDNGSALQFSLVDSNGTVYNVCNTKKDEKGRYCYLRLSFENVNLDLESNKYINSEAKVTAEGEGEMFETFNYKLVITYPEGADIKIDVEDEDKGKDELVIFDGATPIQITKYK